MFSNYKFYIFKKGIGSIQLNIITKKIIDNKGIVHHTPNFDTTHFIISENESFLFISDDLKDKINLKNIIVYSLEWITQSILAKKKIDDIIYQRPLKFKSLNNDIIDNSITTTTTTTTTTQSYNTTPTKNNNNKRTVDNQDFYNGNKEKKIKSESSFVNSSISKSLDNSLNNSWLSYNSDDETDVYDYINSFNKTTQSNNNNNNNSNSNVNKKNTSFDDYNLADTFLNDDSIDKSLGFGFNTQSSEDNSDGGDFISTQSLIVDSPFESQLPPALSPIKPKNNNNNNSPKSLVKYQKYAKNFACQSTKINHNEHITDVIAKLQKKAEADGDNWRQYAYKRAIGILKNLTFKVTSDRQVSHIRGIGSKISDKIKEILLTGTLKKVEMVESDSLTIASEQLSKIHGAGPETIRKWIAKGITSIAKLQSIASQNPQFLTNQQKIGLKYYHDFQLRIPREEVYEISLIIQSAINEIDSKIIMQICGSYRRNKKDCGDIDILFTHSKGEMLTGFLARLTQKLVDMNLLTDHLSQVSANTDKYYGVCKLGENGKYRRIDFQTIIRAEWAFALLYFTGSDHFNRSMRLWARKNGFSLSESHLVKRWGRGDDEIKGEPIPASSEKEIFSLLGLEYKEPHEREI